MMNLEKFKYEECQPPPPTPPPPTPPLLRRLSPAPY